MTEGTVAPATASATPVITPLLTKEKLDELSNKAPIKTAANDAPLVPPPTKDEAKAFAAEFLLGELVKASTAEWKSLSKPFLKMAEFEQEGLLRRTAQKIEAAVKEAIEIVASGARLTFRADVDSVTFKDGVKVTMKLAKSEHAHTLADKSGSSVLIVVEDFARYMNPGDSTKGQPDQPPLFDESKKVANEKDAADKLAPKKVPPKKRGKAPASVRQGNRKGRGK